jgi:hypothetical protein
MKNDIVIEHFFNTVSDDAIIKIAEMDWNMLIVLCMGLTLDIQLYSESLRKRNLVS